MITPTNKLLKVIKGATFSYTFQYLAGTQLSSAPIDLNGYSASWVITWEDGQTFYTNEIQGVLSGDATGQVGDRSSFPSNLQLGAIGGGTRIVHADLSLEPLVVSPSGQLGTLASFPTNMQVGEVGSEFDTGEEVGVYFGGDSVDYANGIIELYISSSDTSSIPWDTAQYQFALTDTNENTYVLLQGGIGVIGSLPSLPG
jgi:hypothetical protein